MTSPPLNHRSLVVKRRRHLPLPAVIKNQLSVIDGPGTVAAGLKQDAVLYRRENFWIVKEFMNDDMSQSYPKDACFVCLGAKTGKSLVVLSLLVVQRRPDFPTKVILLSCSTESRALVRECKTVSSVLKRNSVKKMTLAMGQNNSFSRGFDKILQMLLASLRENSPVIRAKALRAVSIIVEADPEVLRDKHVQSAVEDMLCDSSISVREVSITEFVDNLVAEFVDSQ
ncbi:hypothetical protein AgCh_023541 [Apium graveolens]